MINKLSYPLDRFDSLESDRLKPHDVMAALENFKVFLSLRQPYGHDTIIKRLNKLLKHWQDIMNKRPMFRQRLWHRDEHGDLHTAYIYVDQSEGSVTYRHRDQHEDVVLLPALEVTMAQIQKVWDMQKESDEC